MRRTPHRKRARAPGEGNCIVPRGDGHVHRGSDVGRCTGLQKSVQVQGQHKDRDSGESTGGLHEMPRRVLGY